MCDPKEIASVDHVKCHKIFELNKKNIRRFSILFLLNLILT